MRHHLCPPALPLRFHTVGGAGMSTWARFASAGFLLTLVKGLMGTLMLRGQVLLEERDHYLF